MKWIRVLLVWIMNYYNRKRKKWEEGNSILIKWRKLAWRDKIEGFKDGAYKSEESKGE